MDRGEVLLIDNRIVMHGIQKFEGEMELMTSFNLS